MRVHYDVPCAMVRTCLLMRTDVNLDLTDDGYHDWKFRSSSVYERLDVCMLNTRVTHVLMIPSQIAMLSPQHITLNECGTHTRHVAT